MTCHGVDHVCNPSPCVNGGRCFVEKSFGRHRWTFKCACPRGFKGKLCHSKWKKYHIGYHSLFFMHSVNPKNTQFSAVKLNSCQPVELEVIFTTILPFYQLFGSKLHQTISLFQFSIPAIRLSFKIDFQKTAQWKSPTVIFVSQTH